MQLHVYASAYQIADLGRHNIGIGASITLSLVGTRGSTVGPEILALDWYMADEGTKALVRTGLAEYAFSGKIIEVRSEAFSKGLVFQEALVDCGVPIITATHGVPGIAPFDLANPANQELFRGRYLSGLMSLSAYVGFREPALIEHELQAKVTSIGVVDLLPNAQVLAAVREQRSLDCAGSTLPVILGIEV